jgi:hypothetical protein
MLSDDEVRDIKLWLGWGMVLHFPTKPKDYLRHAMKHKSDFLAIPRQKRKEILRYIIAINKMENDT